MVHRSLAKRGSLPHSRLLSCSLWIGTLILTACSREEARTTPAPAAPPAPTNRIATPLAVRQNLGLTFAKVERRAVARTLRLPGSFELLPSAQREVRVPAAGRVEFVVEQYQQVTAGATLLRLDAPRWRELQEQLASVRAELQLARATQASIPPLLEAHEAHHTEIQARVALWTERVAQLEELKSNGGVGAEILVAARNNLGNARSELAETLEKEADLGARGAESAARLESAHARFDLLLAAAETLTGIPTAQLLASTDRGTAWERLSNLEIKATADGVVSECAATNGSWLEAHSLALEIVDPSRLRFRARAMQSDLAPLRDGMRVSVVAPTGDSTTNSEPLVGTLTLAPLADADHRTLDLIVSLDAVAAWTRAGIAGFVEIELPGAAQESLAIPLRCVVQDGLSPILFRRDPANPDQVIRLEADLGTSDGRWIEVKSGVREGDEIVLDGVYPLLIATSGSLTKGGHFHPDGTFHESDG